jgi:hypothetical protein
MARDRSPLRRKFWWRHVIFTAVAVYVGITAGLYGVQRKLIFVPWSGATAARAEDVGMTVVSTTAADGVTVRHWYAPPQGKHQIVVLFHGNGGGVADLAPWADKFRSLGYGVVLADYRGYSGNSGTPSEDGIYQDARAVLAWLGAQGFGDRDIVLLGWSLGTGVAVQMATEHHPAALVLFAAYSSLTDVAAGQYPILPVRLLMWDRFDSVDKIGKVDTPVMMVHGKDDEIIPPALGRELFGAAHEPKRAIFLPHTHHWIDPSRCLDQVANFLDTIAQTASPPR